MAQKFVLTAQLQLQAPKNLRSVVRDINNQLKGVKVDIDVKGAAKAQKDIKAAADATKQMGKEMEKSAGGVRKMDLALGKALKQVFRYDIARAVLNGFRRTLEDNVRAAIDFEREMIKVAQVTNQSMSSLKDLQNEISRLSTSLGVSSASLVKTSRVLAQTGLSAKDVKIALESLAKTTLAPTFEDITDTTETAIAAMRQFKLEAKDLDRILGQINAVAGKFAVEAGDIGVAIRRAGGAFKSAGGELEELIALFTSVRATTRETAETIATGFRTIFTRMQRPETIEFLRTFGIELQDLSGKFVGPYEAVNRLNAALKNLDPRDVRYSQIVEQLGGFRQVSKVIPLIQQFSTAQAALNVAQKESGSLSKDAITAQASLAVQIQKLTEDVKELFRSIVESKAFQVLASGALKLANALVKIGDTLAPILPMLATLGAVKIAQFGFGRIFGGAGGAPGKQFGGRINRFSNGGLVPGKGNGDTVPAMLESGEFVLRKNAVKSIGAGNLAGMNRYATGGVTSMPSAFVRGNILRSNRTSRKDKSWAFRDGKTAFNDAGPDGNEDTVTTDTKARPLDIESILFNKGILSPRRDAKGKAIKGKYAVKKGFKGRLLSYAGSRLNPTAQGAHFEDLLARSGYLKQGKGFGGNAPLDGKVSGTLAEVKRTKVAESIILDKRLRHEYQKNQLKGIGLTGGADDINFRGKVLQLNDAIGNDSGKMSSLRGKLLAAGGATGHGTDTVPSLLTPGEFVINKKSAQSIGYGNLYSMNKMADGGIVGGGGFESMATGGGGDFDLMGIMMQFGMLQGTLSMFGKQTKTTGDELADTSGKLSGFKTGLGEVLPALGSIAQSGLMIFAKYKVLGGILDQFGQSLFGQSEALTYLINVTMTLAAVMEGISVLKGLDFGGIASGFKNLGGAATKGIGYLTAMATGGIGAGLGSRAADITKRMNVGISEKMQRAGGFMSALGDRATKGSQYVDNVRFGRTGKGYLVGKSGSAARAAGPGGQFRFAPQIGAGTTRATGYQAGQRVLAGGGGRAGSAVRGVTNFSSKLAQAGRGIQIFSAATLAGEIALGSWAAQLEKESRSEFAAARAAGVNVSEEALGRAENAELAVAASDAAGKMGMLVAVVSAVILAVKGFGAGLAILASGPFLLLTAAVVGTAAGLTSLIKWVNGTSESFEAASQIKFENVTKDWEKAMTRHEKGLSTGAQTLDSYAAARRGAAERQAEMTQEGVLWDTEATDESVESLNKFTAALDEATPVILDIAHQRTIDRVDATVERSEAATRRTTLTRTGAFKGEVVTGREAGAERYAIESMDAFEKELERSEESLQEHANTLGMTERELRDQKMKEFRAHYKTTQSLEKLRKANDEMAESFAKSIEVVDAFNSMTSKIEAMDTRLANISGGSSGAVQSGTMAGRFSAKEVGAINTPAEVAEFEARTKAIAAEMGTGGEQLGKEMIDVQKIMSNVTGSLQSEMGRGKIEGQSMADRTMERLESDMGPEAFADLAPHLKTKIRERLNQATAEVEGGKGFNEAFEEAGATIRQDLDDSFEPLREAFESVAKLMDSFNQQLSQIYAERRKKELEIIKAEKSVANLRFKNAQRLAELEGKDVSQADFRANEIAKQRIQLGGTGLDGGTGLVGAGALSQELSRLKQELIENERQIASVGDSFDMAGVEGDKLGDKLANLHKENDKLRQQTNQITDALKDYTNVQERLSVITKELTKLQEIRASKEKTMQDLAFGTDEDREKWADSVFDLKTALTDPRGLEALGGDERRGVQQLLNSMDENQVFAATGQTKDQMMKQLLGGFATSVGGPAWGTSEARGRMGLEANAEEKALLTDIKDIMAESVVAQEGLIEPLRQDRDELNRMLVQVHDNFLTRFQDILEEKFQVRQEKEQRVQAQKVEDIESDISKLNEQLEKIYGKDAVSKMTTDEKEAKFKNLMDARTDIQDLKGLRRQEIVAEGAAQPFIDPTTGKQYDPNAFFAEYHQNRGFSNLWRTGTEGLFGMKTSFAHQKAKGGGILSGYGVGALNDDNRNTPLQAQAIIDAMRTDIRTGAGGTMKLGGEMTEALLQGLDDWVASDEIGGAAGMAKLNLDATALIPMFEKFMIQRQVEATGAKEDAEGRIRKSMGTKDGNMILRKNWDELEELGDVLATFNESDSFKKLEEDSKEAAEEVKKLGEAAKESRENQEAAQGRGDKVLNKASGGLIYASGGRFIPRGTDTIPAMLTPGEFVVRRQAVKSVGVPFLKALNAQGAKGAAQGFSRGGAAYLAGGGMGVSLDSSAFDSSVNRFSTHIDKLGEVLGKGFNVQVGGKVDVVVHIPAADTLAGIKDSVGVMVDNKITQGINNMLAKNFPQIARQTSFIKTRPMGQ